jgi:uncharacterized protein
VLPPSKVERTRFVVDAMLGSLARKLRALGFNASYYKHGEDAGLISISTRERRIILTSDRGLAARAEAEGASVLFVTGESDGRRLSAIAREAKVKGVRLVRGESMCSLCGGELETLAKREVTGMVPSSVERRHRLFFRCATCGQLYWRGSHWKKLRSLTIRLQEK